MDKKLLIIDTDAGGDDALALLLALSQKSSCKILAITCVFGNTTVDNVCNNVLKILKLCDEKEIPVYRGCENALIWKVKVDEVFGKDGLGNVAHCFDHSGLKIEDGCHASNILIDLVKKHHEEGVHLMALGPLTNIAMAHRLNPNFSTNLKSLTLMGGNMEGIGNTTSAAEFNFFADPESAHIVLNEVRCPVYMVPWETTLNNLMTWDIYEKLCEKKTKKGQFFKMVTALMRDRNKARGRKGILDCDFLAVASLIEPSCIKNKLTYPVSVETQGKFTRGQAIIERRCTEASRNVINILTDFNEDVLNKLRMLMIEN